MNLELSRRFLARCQTAVWAVDDFIAAQSATKVTGGLCLDGLFYLAATLTMIQPVWGNQ